MAHWALYLTDFADAGVIVPVCAAVAATLFVFRQNRVALSWIAVSVCVWTVMLILKISGHACDDMNCAVSTDRLNLVSPSGHVAAAAAAYGGLAGLVLGSTGQPVRRSCIAAILIALIVGVTRVLLDAHSVSEVIVGGIVGVTGAVLFTRHARGWISRRRRAMLLGVVALSMLLFHGTHMTWEPEIRALSGGAAHAFEETR